MEGTVIFEIPVYCMSQSRFADYLSDAMRKEEERNIKNFGESIISNLDKVLGIKFSGNTTWKYNQRIAYITITMTARDIIYYFHKPIRNTRANILSDTKVYVDDGFMIGHHFNIEDNWSNSDIANEVKKWLNVLIREEGKFLKGKYVDHHLFDLYIDSFDFRALQDKCRNN